MWTFIRPLPHHRKAEVLPGQHTSVLVYSLRGVFNARFQTSTKPLIMRGPRQHIYVRQYRLALPC